MGLSVCVALTGLCSRAILNQGRRFALPLARVAWRLQRPEMEEADKRNQHLDNLRLISTKPCEGEMRGRP